MSGALGNWHASITRLQTANPQHITGTTNKSKIYPKVEPQNFKQMLLIPSLGARCYLW